MKEEMLEEAAENYAVQFLLEDEQETDSANRKQAFIAGAKWQQERSYSEEEVIVILTERCKHFGTSVSRFNKLLLKQDLEWFEQFKKK